MLKSDWSK